MGTKQRKPDPDHHTMEIACLIEKPLADMVSNRIRVLDALIEHAVPDDTTLSIRFIPTDEATKWWVYIYRGDTISPHPVDSLEHAIRMIPELVDDIKNGRRKLE